MNRCSDLATGLFVSACYDDATHHFAFSRSTLMERGNLSRRGFLQRSLTGLAVGAGLPLWFAREVLAQQQEATPRRARRAAANDRVLIGAIGIGSPGGRNEQLMHDVLGLKRLIQYVAV